MWVEEWGAWYGSDETGEDVGSVYLRNDGRGWGALGPCPITGGGFNRGPSAPEVVPGGPWATREEAQAAVEAHSASTPRR